MWAISSYCVLNSSSIVVYFEKSMMNSSHVPFLFGVWPFEAKYRFNISLVGGALLPIKLLVAQTIEYGKST